MRFVRSALDELDFKAHSEGEKSNGRSYPGFNPPLESERD